jgi:serine/threonine protein kinase
MTQNTTHNSGPRAAASPVPVTERATVAPGPLAWISRLRTSQLSIDPKATLTYIVARSDHDAPTIAPAPAFARGIGDDFATGTMLQERYRLLRELGRGGMGIVYLGRDERLARSVAVKVILSDCTGSSTSDSMDSRVRSSFAEEARLGASLTHPAIATVFDFGFHHDSPFTVFEFIEGETLRELLERRGKLPLDEVRLIIGPIAQALDFAHARLIVHRDLKPENIRATEQRLFKILDLGLAREFSRQDDWRFAGTPAYAAPEQAAERASDGRTDQYALAVIIFELLTGSRPFQSNSWLDLLEKHYSEPPPAPRSLVPELSEAVEAAILKALEKDPNRRFSTCTELAVALGCQFLAVTAPLPRILLETEIKKTGGRFKSRFFPFALKRPKTHLTLEPEALWAIHRTELVRWPIAAIHDLKWRGGRRLSFRIRGVSGKQTQWLHFRSRKERRGWTEALQSLIQSDGRATAEVAEDVKEESTAYLQPKHPEHIESTIEPRVEPVVLLKGRPATRFQLLGMVEAKGPNRRRSENGLAIRAAMMGADAVVDLNSERLPGFTRTDRRSSGTAVRAVDHEGRLELKSRWFDNQITRIRIPMLVMAFFFGGIAQYITGNSPTGEASAHRLNLKGAGDAVSLFAWLVIVGLTLAMSILRWPQLVRPTAICFLVKAVQNGLSIVGSLAGVAFMIFAMPIAGFASAADWTAAAVSAVMIPATILNIFVSLSFLLFYLYLGRQAWRVDQEFRRLAAESIQTATIPWSRRLIGALAWVMAIGFAVSLIVWEAFAVTQKVVDQPVSAPKFSGDRLDNAKAAIGLSMNDLAWRQATDPDPAKRSADKALENALAAVGYEPGNSKFLDTLGVARYRTGNYPGAIADLENSIKIGGFSAASTFFVAMARAQLGELDQARKLFDQADRWMRENHSDDGELKRFREEAAAVLYMKSLEPAQAQPKKTEPAKRNR